MLLYVKVGRYGGAVPVLSMGPARAGPIDYYHGPGLPHLSPFWPRGPGPPSGRPISRNYVISDCGRPTSRQYSNITASIREFPSMFAKVLFKCVVHKVSYLGLDIN